jgi:hypothetical protein
VSPCQAVMGVGNLLAGGIPSGESSHPCGVIMASRASTTPGSRHQTVKGSGGIV